MEFTSHSLHHFSSLVSGSVATKTRNRQTPVDTSHWLYRVVLGATQVLTLIVSNVAHCQKVTLFYCMCVVRDGCLANNFHEATGVRHYFDMSAEHAVGQYRLSCHCLCVTVAHADAPFLFEHGANFRRDPHAVETTVNGRWHC